MLMPQGGQLLARLVDPVREHEGKYGEADESEQNVHRESLLGLVSYCSAGHSLGCPKGVFRGCDPEVPTQNAV